MTIEECYSRMGADYNDVLWRLEKPERIEKFLRRFLNEISYEAFHIALMEENAEAAFRAAHSLKGICLNLGLTSLYLTVNALTEELRCGKITPAAESLERKLTSDYMSTTQIIRDFFQIKQ